MPVPSFTTARLVVRRLAGGDAAPIAAMDADPEVTRFTGGPETDPAHLEEIEGWFADEDDPAGFGMWAIATREEPDRFLGWIMLWTLPGWEPEVEIGWRLTRTAWGRGFATEAASAVMEHAFTTVGLDRVVAVLDPANDRSRRVCEKLGMVTAGKRRAYDTDCALYVKERFSAP